MATREGVLKEPRTRRDPKADAWEGKRGLVLYTVTRCTTECVQAVTAVTALRRPLTSTGREGLTCQAVGGATGRRGSEGAGSGKA